MENLAKYFEELRIKRDLPYGKIWEDLRLPQDKIKLIESGDFEALGEYGIRKAMIYNYARYLEADLTAVMDEFNRLYPPTSALPPTTISHSQEKRIMLSTNFLWMIGILVIVVILGSIILYASKRGFLEAPDLFSKAKADSSKAVATEPVKEEPAVPDSERVRMLELTRMMQPKPLEEPEKKDSTSQQPSLDNTDYMGKFLGKNPMNVQIH
jgi:cytoskeletal protein RodZ